MNSTQKNFQILCDTLDQMHLKYEKNEAEWAIEADFSTDDLPVELHLHLVDKNQIVIFMSPLPFTVSEDKRVDLAIALHAVNFGLLDGSFDYDIEDGKIAFRLTSSYREVDLSDDVFNYMLHIALVTADRFNDKFLALAKGYMSLEEFLESLDA